MLGIIILPITSGDTAFRSARLIIADGFGIEQKSILKCLAVAIPLFVLGYICSQIGFDKLWKYFGWANQTLAAIVLWLSVVYLRKNANSGLIAIVPAVFITTVIATFLFNNELMHIGLDLKISTLIAFAISTALLCLTLYCISSKAGVENNESES